MATSDESSGSVEQEVRRMQALKAEHRQLLDRIASDQGMAPETRRALVEHVLEEEDEKLARIAELTSAGGGGSAPAGAEPAEPAPADTPPMRARLSVGSLRQPDDRPRSPQGSIGSLRDG